MQVGHAKGPDEDAIKAWIYDRAKAFDAEDAVPASWKGQWKGKGTSPRGYLDVAKAKRARAQVRR